MNQDSPVLPLRSVRHGSRELNVGNTHAEFRDRFSAGQWEPDPVAFASLQRTVAANPTLAPIRARPVAIAPRAGEIAMGAREEPGDSMSSSLFADNQAATARRLEDFESSWPAAARFFRMSRRLPLQLVRALVPESLKHHWREFRWDPTRIAQPPGTSRWFGPARRWVGAAQYCRGNGGTFREVLPAQVNPGSADIHLDPAELAAALARLAAA